VTLTGCVRSHQARDIAGHERGIDHHGLAIALQRAADPFRQRSPQRRERLAEARTRELGVRVFPQQSGQEVARKPDAGLQRQAREQGLRLAGRHADFSPARRANPQTTEHFDLQFDHAPPSTQKSSGRPSFHGKFTPVETPA